MRIFFFNAVLRNVEHDSTFRVVCVPPPPIESGISMRHGRIFYARISIHLGGWPIHWIIPHPPPPPPQMNRNHSRVYAHAMLIPHHLNPLSRKKKDNYTPYLGYWLPLAVTKNTPLSGLSWEIFPRLQPPNAPLSRENGHTHVAPLCSWVGGGGGGVCATCHQEWLDYNGVILCGLYHTVLPYLSSQYTCYFCITKYAV